MQLKSHNLRINGDRLWASLMDMAKIGTTPKGGNNRQALTAEDSQGRALFKSWCEAAGCTVHIDPLGSMFARRAGQEDLPPILIGSHLDTQPTGGKFDGVLGVLAGLELVRCLNEAGVKTKRPIEIVNWTNEEGCRFSPAMLASAAFVGLISEKTVLESRDSNGALFADELTKMGMDCTTSLGNREIAAYLELHIEQGPILEAEGYDVGFVTAGQGHRWYDVKLTGFESHAGSTPMRGRRDALLGAAGLIQAVNTIGLNFAPLAVATVGQIHALPNSRNVIPSEVFLTIDIRHPDNAILEAMDAQVRQAFAECLIQHKLKGIMTDISICPPIPFAPSILDIIRTEAIALSLKGRDIVSGAGHDAFHLAKMTPTAMIFTPCKDGVSHNEAEDILPKWAFDGANLLLRSALILAGDA
jgi:beta-ureidopropionase / N-carbamoyl-L-amino-acid hydrolase